MGFVEFCLKTIEELEAENQELKNYIAKLAKLN
jgi:hypothetical protein